MRVWYFSEMAYHPAWEEGLKRGSLRVVLPSANYDPKIGHQLLNRYLDEFRLCDEVGLDIMVNEHHSTSTCLTISVPMALAVIARETKRARLLSLGTPIANRPDPVRVAEEMAWLDVLSGGRLEMGGPRGEIGGGRLEERHTGAGHRVRLVQGVSFALVDGVGEGETELLVSKRDGAGVVEGVAQDRR